MADLTQASKDVYQTILSIASGNISGTAKTVTDGGNNNTALQVSTDKVRSTGDIEADGRAVITGSVTADSFTGDGSAMTGVFKSAWTSRSIDLSAGADVDFETTDVVALCTGGANSLILTSAASMSGRLILIKEVGGVDSFTVDGSGAETIDGSATLTVAASEGYILFCDATEWHIIAKF